LAGNIARLALRMLYAPEEQQILLNVVRPRLKKSIAFTRDSKY